MQHVQSGIGWTAAANTTSHMSTSSSSNFFTATVTHKETASTSPVWTAVLPEGAAPGSQAGYLSFFEFRRQMEYKAERRDGIVVVADRWFASSKICSVCGVKQDKMPLAVRQWTCPDCGAIHDRDVNAARNLLALGLAALSRPTVSSAGCEACGEEGAGSGRKARVKPASTKQEVSFGPV